MAYILNSPVFTGNPQAPTPLTADNSNSLATTAFVKAQGYGAGTVTAIGVTAANGVSGSSSGGATPNLTITLGAITPTSVNGLTLAIGAQGFTIAGGTISKTMTFKNSLTLQGTDAAILDIGGGGTLGTAAYTTASAYEPALGNPGTSGWVLSSTTGGVRTWVAMAGGNLTGDVTSVGLATTLAASVVMGKLLAGYTAGSDATVLAATDSFLIGFQKLQYQNTLKAPINNPTFTGTVTLAADPTLALHAATKQYVDAAVVGLLDDRGSYNASVNTFPASGGSGSAGAVMKGDIWYVSVAGTLGGQGVAIGSSVRALIDAPGQTAANWSIIDGPAVTQTITDDTTNASTVYPVWVTAAGNVAEKISTTKLSFVPNTGILTATGFVGNLTGNASGSAASITGNLTGDVTSVGMATTLTGATILGKTISSYTAGTDATALANTDTLLQALQKLQYQNNIDLISGISTKTTTYNPTHSAVRSVRKVLDHTS